MEKLKSFNFSRIKNVSGKYDALMDGSIYKLKEGSDYRSVAAVQNAIYLRARKLGVKLHTQRLDRALVVQAETRRVGLNQH